MHGNTPKCNPYLTTLIVTEVCFRVKLEFLHIKEGEMEEQETLYTVKEVADRFKVNHRTVLNWISNGEMACYQVGYGSMIRVGEHHIREYLDQHRTENPAKPS